MKHPSPEIDTLAGINYYSTEFEGIGGEIKKNYTDFYVKEIINSNFLKQLAPYHTATNVFPIYEIEKRGMDSNHAILEIRKKTGINLKIVGIKDAKATTIQYASSNSNSKSRNRGFTNWKSSDTTTTFNNNRKRNKDDVEVDNVNKPYGEKDRESINLRDIRLLCIGYSKKPIEKDMLIGNTFKIRIAGIKPNKINSFDNFLSQINNIGNYYGLQRFGSERMVTHLVGKAILDRKFNQALEILLTHTTKFDSKFSIEIRKKLQDIKNHPNIIKEIPRGMDIERYVAQAILRGKDPISAIRTIPINIRRLFVQAFQAFLFNRTLSTAIHDKYSLRIPEKNDICFELENDDLVFGKIRKFENNTHKKNKIHKQVPIIRLPGYSFQPGKGRFDTILKKIMTEENISAKDFFIKELQELSEPGGFRQAAYICKDFEFHIDGNSAVVEFSVPKGSYATILLREIIKPINPILAGF